MSLSDEVATTTQTVQEPEPYYDILQILDEYGDAFREVLPVPSNVTVLSDALEEVNAVQRPLMRPIRGDTSSRGAFGRPDSSTAKKETPEETDEAVMALFRAAKEEVFEDGMESEFSRELVRLVKKYGSVALDLMGSLIISEERVNPEIASEALRWLGRMEHAQTYRARLLLLEHGLRCSSPRVRDGALLGLASLDDPDSIPHIRLAVEWEQVEELREDMELVLAQLENVS